MGLQGKITLGLKPGKIYDSLRGAKAPLFHSLIPYAGPSTSLRAGLKRALPLFYFTRQSDSAAPLFRASLLPARFVRWTGEYARPHVVHLDAGAQNGNLYGS